MPSQVSVETARQVDEAQGQNHEGGEGQGGNQSLAREAVHRRKNTLAHGQVGAAVECEGQRFPWGSIAIGMAHGGPAKASATDWPWARGQRRASV